MAVVETSSGTQTATIGTTHTLATPTAGKTYVLHLDLTNMAAGDFLEVYLSEKVLSGSTQKGVSQANFAGAQIEAVYMSIPIPSANGCQFQLKQTAGTGRAYDWSVQSLD